MSKFIEIFVNPKPGSSVHDTVTECHQICLEGIYRVSLLVTERHTDNPFFTLQIVRSQPNVTEDFAYSTNGTMAVAQYVAIRNALIG